MDIELALSAHSLLFGEEEGEVHLDDESHPDAFFQGLYSSNAVVESSAGHNKQAHGDAVPLTGGAGKDVKAPGQLSIPCRPDLPVGRLRVLCRARLTS